MPHDFTTKPKQTVSPAVLAGEFFCGELSVLMNLPVQFLERVKFKRRSRLLSSEIVFELSDSFLFTNDAEEVVVAVAAEVAVGRRSRIAVEAVVVAVVLRSRIAVAAVAVEVVVLRSRIAVEAVAVGRLYAGVPIRDARGVLCQFRDQECTCRGNVPICPTLESRQVACPVFQQ